MVASVPTGRSGGQSRRRFAKRLTAEFSGPDESVPQEMTFTAYVSTQDIRSSAVPRWQPGTRVVVTDLRNDTRSEGKVAYCRFRKSGDFAVGVDLSGQLQSRMGRIT